MPKKKYPYDPQAAVERRHEWSRKANKKYHQSHRAESITRHLKWAKEHPESTRLYNQRRRSNLKDSDLTLTQWLSVLKSHRSSCAYCDSQEGIEIDHIIPISRGGRDTASNVQPLCGSCNRVKGDHIG